MKTKTKVLKLLLLIVFLTVGFTFNFNQSKASDPVALDVNITGVSNVGSVLTGHYTYSNADSLWQVAGEKGFSEGQANYVSSAINSRDKLYVAYQDIEKAGKISVMRFDDNRWTTVGEKGFSDSQTDYISLAIDSRDVVYVAYQDWANTKKVTVMKFDGTRWLPVGNPAFSDGQADLISLALDSRDTPYVAYSDQSVGGQITVMKFDGDRWVLVGRQGFSDSRVDYTALAIDSRDTPYVAYPDRTDASKATVMKFDGDHWVLVGHQAFSDGQADYISLDVDSSRTPYVAYSDQSVGGQVTVMKFDGDRWVLVGRQGFSAGRADYTSLILSLRDELYVVYQDWERGKGSTVMKFNGDDWTLVGTPGFSDSLANYTSIVIDSNEVPYVAYQDWEKGKAASVMKYSTELEGTSIFRWLRDSIAIGDATSQIYTLATADAGKVIKFEVTPKGQSGTLGSQVQSAGLTINSFPVATNVTITGMPNIGQTLTGHYTYSDADSNLEGISTYKWYKDGIEIPLATSTTYTLVASDAGKTIKFGITPRALSGSTPGIEVQSSGLLINVITHTLTYSAGSNGSITGNSPQTINHGSDGTLVTAVPNSGYHFVNWSDASTTNPRTDTNVTGNVSVTANFEIDVTSGGNTGGGGGGGGYSYSPSIAQNENVSGNNDPDNSNQIIDESGSGTTNTNTNSGSQINQYTELLNKFSDLSKDAGDLKCIDKLLSMNAISGYANGTLQLDRIISRAEAVALIVKSLALPIETEFVKLYKDINADQWYSQYIVTAQKYGIITGYGNSYFRPDQKVNRAEFIVMLIRAMKLSTGGENDFTDVPNDAWYSDSIQIAKRIGLVTPYIDGSFRPGNLVSRDDAFNFLCRALEVKS